jgi:hypothetical protein
MTFGYTFCDSQTESSSSYALIDMAGNPIKSLKKMRLVFWRDPLAAISHLHDNFII